MDFETIIFKNIDRVGYLTFNRPAVRNAINTQMIAEVESVLTYIKENDVVDVLMLTGEGISFCAGADTTEFLSMTPEENRFFLDRFGKMVLEIERLELPVVGVINGFAFGGGAEIAIACDFRITSSRASFRFPGAAYGLVISSRTLPVIVGPSKAKELLFRASIVSAEEALRIGLSNQLLEEDQLHVYAAEVAREIQRNSMDAVKKVKETINTGIGASLEERIELEQRANDYLVEHTNYRDTFSAFVEKRTSK